MSLVFEIYQTLFFKFVRELAEVLSLLFFLFLFVFKLDVNGAGEIEEIDRK